jgi:cobalt-zinc-cadmium efflux system protein
MSSSVPDRSDADPGGADPGASDSAPGGHSHGGHSHGGHPHGADASTGRLVGGIVLNLGITVAEAIAGVMSGSLALLADAAHNLNDTASLALTLYARIVAGRGATENRTFGHRRAEIIGAFVNLITLVLIALYLLVEAVERALNPRPVDGQLVMMVAGVALAGNVATAWLLHRPSKESLNVEAAYVHIVADALASVAVLAAGGLVLGFGWTWVDPVMTALISGYILWQSAHMLRQTIDILMMTAPEDLDVGEMVTAMEAVDGVEDVHHVHVWRLDEHRSALEAHVRIGEREVDVAERVTREVKNRLASAFDIGHATLEVEYGRCSDTSPAGDDSTHPPESSVQAPTPPVIASDC